MAILDSQLQALLLRQARLDTRKGSIGKATGTTGSDELLYIALKFHGDIDPLIAAGFQPASIDAPIAYGATTLAGLSALARHPQVLAIEKQRRMHLSLDGSVPDIKADAVWARSGDRFSGYTGRGVIVGIVDTGIDFRHHAFRAPDGRSRVLKIWDQVLTPIASELSPGPITDPRIAPVPVPLGYGVEYDQAQIDETLRRGGGAPVRHEDADGHGTHVAGIAAGDGSQSGHCHLAYRYIGVATEADLMIVRLWGLTKGDPERPPTASDAMIDAVRYLMDQARQVNKPLVVNLSLGRVSATLDGTAADCVSIDQLLRRNSAGRAIVFAAGNDANNAFRASAVVPSDDGDALSLGFRVMPDDKKIREILVEYSGSTLEARLTSPVPGDEGVIDWVALNASDDSDTANGDGTVELFNLPNRINVILTPPEGEDDDGDGEVEEGERGTNRAGKWVLELRTTTGEEPEIEAFCLHVSDHDFTSPYFISDVTTETTLVEQATGFESIAVGSYREGSRLSVFSGRGPTMGTPPRVKPELAAPGEDIASAGLRRDRSCRRCCCACYQDFYVDKSGTSMAAPHVAGVIALMLHKNPTLTHAEIRKLLIDNAADKPDDSTPDEDVGWGAGRVDAELTIESVAEINPPVAMIAPVVHPRAALPAHVAPLRDRLLGTARGKALIDLFERYATEVWTLVQHNRRVATVWHRCKGPIWVRLALQAMHAPETALPLEADGLPLRDGLRRFAETLTRFGSPDLRRDLQAWEPALTRIEDGMTLHALIAIVGNASNHG